MKRHWSFSTDEKNKDDKDTYRIVVYENADSPVVDALPEYHRVAFTDHGPAKKFDLPDPDLIRVHEVIARFLHNDMPKPKATLYLESV